MTTKQNKTNPAPVSAATGGAFRLSNAASVAFQDAAKAGRAATNAADAFDAAVIAFFTSIRGAVGTLPQPAQGKVQPLAWIQMRDAWIMAYLTAEELTAWKAATGDARNKLQNKAVQALNRFRAGLATLAGKGVVVDKGDDVAKVADKASKAKGAKTGADKRAMPVIVSDYVSKAFKAVVKDRDGENPTLTAEVSRDIVAALYRVNGMLPGAPKLAGQPAEGKAPARKAPKA
jgi:hypothetical protein